MNLTVSIFFTLDKLVKLSLTWRLVKWGNRCLRTFPPLNVPERCGLWFFNKLFSHAWGYNARTSNAIQGLCQPYLLPLHLLTQTCQKVYIKLFKLSVSYHAISLLIVLPLTSTTLFLSYHNLPYHFSRHIGFVICALIDTLINTQYHSLDKPRLPCY